MINLKSSLFVSKSLKQKKPSIIVALDYNDLYQTLEFVDKITPNECKLKIGKELFIKSGNKLIRELKYRGFDIFLDLKFHDIPNTVGRAVNAAAELGVWMISIHASGGEQMMIEAKKAISSFKNESPILVAVTILTSMNEKDLISIGVNNNINNYINKLAFLANSCEIDGIVCSPLQAKMLKINFKNNLIFVSPGIRFYSNKNDDHKTTSTHLEAKKIGVDYIVIGRPIIYDKNPVYKLKTIIDELNNNINL